MLISFEPDYDNQEGSVVVDARLGGSYVSRHALGKLAASVVGEWAIVPVEVRQISLSGRVQCRLDNLSSFPFGADADNKAPAEGEERRQLTAAFGFVSKPRIRLTIRPLNGVDLMQVPKLSDWMHDMFQEALISEMVFPLSVGVPVHDWLREGFLKEAMSAAARRQEEEEVNGAQEDEEGASAGSSSAPSGPKRSVSLSPKIGRRKVEDQIERATQGSALQAKARIQEAGGGKSKSDYRYTDKATSKAASLFNSVDGGLARLKGAWFFKSGPSPLPVKKNSLPGVSKAIVAGEPQK